MFNLIKGAKINGNIALKEEYEINGNRIYANISVENICKVMEQFVKIEKGNKFCLLKFLQTLPMKI